MAVDADVVVDVLDSGHAFDDFFRRAPGAAFVDRPRERDFSTLDRNLDVGRIDIRVASERFTDIFPDPLIGSLVAFGRAEVGAFLTRESESLSERLLTEGAARIV